MLKILVILLAFIPLSRGSKIIDRHYEFSWSDTNATQEALKSEESSSVTQCLHLCQKENACLGIEYQAALHTCRLFSLLEHGLSQPGATYQRATWARLSVETHNNSLWHTSIPVSTYSNDTVDRTVFSTSIIKRSATSGIRVTYSGSFGTFGCYGCCTKFWFTFNGSPCTNPHNFDFVFYNTPAANVHWPAVKDGICDGLPVGTVTVAIDTSICFYILNRPRSSSNIAFLYDSHLIIQEVYYPTSHPNDASLLGITQGTPTTDVLSNTCSPAAPFITTTYSKHASDTDLLVLMSGNFRISTLFNCGRWYFLFNGQECSTPGKVGELNALTLFDTEFLRGGVVGGICSNLPAGVITVDFTVSACPSSVNLTSLRCVFGWGSNENVIVEEVRRKIPTPTPDNPAFNLDFTWWAGEVTKDSGVIKTLTYDKVSVNTALRFRFFGSLSSVVSGAGGSAWCFEVDGQACADPGPACTALWSDVRMELRRPYQLLSVCRGVFPGPRRVELVVKPLSGVPGDASTGWSAHANNYLVVDEVFIN